MTIKPDLLIPADGELGQMLLQIAEDSDASTWKIANITNDLIDELDGASVTDGEKITMKDIYRAVAVRCKGRKINTIRRIAECARDYSLDLQEKYAGLLSFEHFKVSRRLFQGGYTPSIEYGLEWCVSGDDEKITAGRFHTTGEMINHFVPEMRNDSPIAYWEKVRLNLYDKLILIDNDTDRSRALDAWQVIDFVLNKE